MAAVYTIRLVDQASASAARVQASLSAVAAAATRTAAAFMTTDRAYRAVASEAERQARAQLKVARALEAVDKKALAIHRSKLPRALGGLGDAFGSLRTGVTAATAFVTAAVGGMAVRLGRDFLEAAGSAQQFERNFNRMTGDPAELERTRTLIQKLGLDLAEGEQAAIRFRSSFNETDTQGFLKFFRAMNLDKTQLNSVSRAIGQIQGLGKVQGDELNEVTQAIPGLSRKNIYEEFAKIRGIDVPQAMKAMAKDGAATDAIRAMMAAALNARKVADPTGAFDTEGRVKLGGADAAVAESSGDINQRLANLDNGITRIKRNLGENLAKSGFLDDLDRLFARLESFSKLDFGIFERLMGVWKTLNGDYSVDATKILGIDPASGLGKILDFKPGQAMGEALGAGVAAGIANSQGQAEAAMKSMAAGVITQGNDAFGIHSPSKVMKETGADVAAGLAIGVDDNADLAFSSAESMADGAVAEAEMAAATGGGVSSAHMANVGAAAGNAMGGAAGGAVSGVSVQVAITVDGSQGPAATVDAIRDFFTTGEFAAILERELEGSGA
jgi:tape measure domain-containing protein